MADPDAVAAGFRLVRRAPIDDDVMVEPGRHRGSVVPVGMAMTILMVAMVIMTDAGAAHVVMMTLLRCAGGILVADNAGAVLAELAVHLRVAVVELCDA